MPVGRLVKVLADSSRLETLSDLQEQRVFPVSIFYPASPDTIVNQNSKLLSLFDPASNEIKNILVDMGISEEKIIGFSVPVADNINFDPAYTSCPVVVFSPAFGVDRDMYIELVTALVESGYIVISVGTPHESLFTVFPDGKVVRQSKQVANQDFTDFAVLKEFVRIRAEDVRYVIEYLATWNADNNLLRNKLDLSRIGVIGHSLGGAAVFDAAIQDDRLQCVILLDASLHLLNNSILDAPLLNIRQEAASLPELRESMREVVATAYIDGQRRLYDSLNSPKSFMKIIGSDHMSFSTLGTLASGESSRHVISTMQQATIAFLKEHLSGESGAYTKFLGENRPANLIEIDGEGIAFDS